MYAKKSLILYRDLQSNIRQRNRCECVLFKVVQDGPEVEAEEGVRVAGFVIKFLYLKVEGGQFKQTAVLPEKKKKIKETQ